MLQNIGPQQASTQGIQTPLPISWLGRADAPPTLPASADIYRLTGTEVQNLLAQIGYDQSQWDYSKIGTNNQLGRYQFTTQTLENYGLLAAGSNSHYGTDCINYKNCWRPITIKGSNSYSSYNYNVTSLSAFLSSVAGQEHLAYQIVYDTYNKLVKNGSIQDADTADVVAGMIYVGWTLGPGVTPTNTNISGTGAYAWRYSGVGDGANSYNSGRYALGVLGLANIPVTKTVIANNFLSINGIGQDGTPTSLIVPLTGPVTTNAIVNAVTSSAAQLAPMATMTSLAVHAADSSTGATVTIPSSISLAQGTTTSSQLNQQLQSSGTSLVGSVVGTLATGITGAVAQGLGPAGTSVIGLAASAIANPSQTLKTVENMATALALGIGINQINQSFSSGVNGIYSISQLAFNTLNIAAGELITNIQAGSITTSPGNSVN